MAGEPAKFFSGSGSWLFFQAFPAPASIFFQAAPAPGFFSQPAPAPRSQSQKHQAPAPDLVKFGKIFISPKTSKVKLQKYKTSKIIVILLVFFKNGIIQKSKSSKVQKCEIVKSKNRIIQESKSSTMQSWNLKKIYAAFENNVCKQKILFVLI